MAIAEKSAGEYYQFEDINYAVLALLREAQREGARGVTLLDLGCGRGRLGLEIERMGLKVTGLDHYPPACETARKRLSEVMELDIMNLERVERALAGRQFDWLLAADVLEHSANPRQLLSFYRQFLKPDGYVIVSLPNVAVWDNRFRLLLGKFDYTDSGVMDRTHLRFFTFRSARQLLIESGFTPIGRTWQEGIVRAFLPIVKRVMGSARAADPGAMLESPFYKFYERYVMPIEHALAGIAPGLLAFRVVQLARRSDSSKAPNL